MTHRRRLLIALLLGTAVSAEAPSSPTTQQPSPGAQQSSPPVANQNPSAVTTPVPISAEPHHRLVLQNDFTHVYNVMVPPLDATSCISTTCFTSTLRLDRRTSSTPSWERRKSI